MKQQISFLELFIINTLTYFDLFDYPLTLTEIYSYLYTGGMEGGKFSMYEIKKDLEENEKLQKIITTDRGFFCLKGRENIIDSRLQRYNIADYKFKIAVKVIKWLRFFPFIKMIGVCNNLAYFNAKKDADIDLFIITSGKRLYLTRLAVTLFVGLLGKRRHGKKITNRLCLSFWITEDNLNLSEIKIAPDDIYLTYWFATLFPIYQRDNFYNKFIKANSWFKKYIPNWQGTEISYRYKVEDTKFSRFAYKSKEFIYGSFLFNWLEALAEEIQLLKMSQNKKDLAVRGDKWVIISETMLKFHEKDARMEYLRKWEEKTKQFIDQI